MKEPTWFHVFNADTGEWLHDDGTFGSYAGCDEFGTIGEAEAAATSEKTEADDDAVLIVLGDFGEVMADETDDEASATA